MLSDSDNKVAIKYGAFGEKNMYGRKVMGTIRSTFLIDVNGKIEAVWSPVKVNGHVDQVLAILRGESPPPKSAPTKKKAAKKKTKKKK